MKIIFCGGGTAGHVTPNIALINTLKGEKFYIGTDAMEKQLTQPLVDSKQLQYFTITASKFERKFTLKNLLLPFRLIRSVSQSKQILKQISPDVVFSKGGYVGLPVVIAAHMLKIPAVIHESDSSMGLANKLALPFCTKLLSTFPCHKKATVCGAIIRKQLYSGDKQKGLSQMKFDGKKPVLLFTGGSLGADTLNKLAQKCAPELSEKFDIFVLTGKGKTVSSKYLHHQPYSANIEDIFSATSIAVTRGGSNTLCELTALNIPFVVIPLEKCSRGEQKVNAQYFSQCHAGIALPDDCTPEQLTEAINTLHKNRKLYVSSQKQMRIDGTKEVAQQIECVAKSK